MKEFLLGVIQGLTEFLPVSSSGHLSLFSKIMSIPSDLAFFAFLHLATFLVVLLFLWSDVWSILLGLFKLDKSAWSLVFKIIVSSIPAGLVGLLFESKIEQFFSSQKVIGVFFLFTAILLWLSDTFHGKKTIDTITYIDALVIGLFQMVAILPGISRSGLTLIGALLIGMSRVDAFKYSFLLSLPVTLAAGMLELKYVVFTLQVFSGFTGAFIAGLVALIIVKNMTISAHMKFFSLYLLIPAIISFFVK
jgi:undecaprenyl-diphosphatase